MCSLHMSTGTIFRNEEFARKCKPTFAHGAMVAHQILTLQIEVRVLVGELFLNRRYCFFEARKRSRFSENL